MELGLRSARGDADGWVAVLVQVVKALRRAMDELPQYELEEVTKIEAVRDLVPHIRAMQSRGYSMNAVAHSFLRARLSVTAIAVKSHVAQVTTRKAVKRKRHKPKDGSGGARVVAPEATEEVPVEAAAVVATAVPSEAAVVTTVAIEVAAPVEKTSAPESTAVIPKEAAPLSLTARRWGRQLRSPPRNDARPSCRARIPTTSNGVPRLCME
jgi:hypothetical protein